MNRKTVFAGFLMLYVVLGSWKGYVALFDRGAEEPRQIYPQSVSSLSAEDQAALEEGIVVRNDRQLEALLERLRTHGTLQVP